MSVEHTGIREAVRDHYAAAVVAVERAAQPGPSGPGGCCGESSAGTGVAVTLYSAAEVAQLPAGAVRVSMGCGNPAALAELRPGEVVLDLGSGGGIDVLLSARRVGPSGFAYGVDMTDEMLAVAERNAAEQGAANVRFLKGTIEEVPLPDAAVDVVISNCVINLSGDKGRVLREAFRVLRPGGRFAVADIVIQGELPGEIRNDPEQWVGCLAGALEEEEYRSLLASAGFEGVEVQVVDEPGAAVATEEAPSGRAVSALVRARKPAVR